MNPRRIARGYFGRNFGPSWEISILDYFQGVGWGYWHLGYVCMSSTEQEPEMIHTKPAAYFWMEDGATPPVLLTVSRQYPEDNQSSTRASCLTHRLRHIMLIVELWKLLISGCFSSHDSTADAVFTLSSSSRNFYGRAFKCFPGVSTTILLKRELHSCARWWYKFTPGKKKSVC